MEINIKIIFLDIDGVLNNASTTEKFCGFVGIDTRLRDMFINWLKDRDYKIVLSSSWRVPSAFGDFKAELNRNGIFWVGETPYLRGTCRGHEIQAYLITNPPAEQSKYVILDDLGPSEFLKHQRPFVVQTSAVRGLEKKELSKIDELLGT